MLFLFRLINILTLSLRFRSSCLATAQDEISACIKLIHRQDKIVCQLLVSIRSFSRTFKLTADKLPLFLLSTKAIKLLSCWQLHSYPISFSLFIIASTPFAIHLQELSTPALCQ